jgi:antitoxin component of RelBE/YafQ-DinJ toxin-antitoxin module
LEISSVNETAILRAKVPARRLHRAEKILQKLSLTPSDAANILLAQIEIRQELPFEVRVQPNHSLTSGVEIMYVAFPQVRVGEPVRYQSLPVFPLFDGSSTPVEYALAGDGIASGAVSVEEVSEGGSVPDLLVENKGDVRVLFLESEELVGAKQNRILNTSVLIAAHSKTRIPVSCVEQGRWRYRSRRFGSSGSHSSSKLRYFLKRSVTKSVMAKRGHRSDQGKVWEEVARQQSALGIASPTHAMADTFDAYADKAADFRKELQYIDGACGLAAWLSTSATRSSPWLCSTRRPHAGKSGSGC